MAQAFPKPQPLRSRKVVIKRLPDFARDYVRIKQQGTLAACIYLSGMIHDETLNSQLTTLSFMVLDKPDIFENAGKHVEQLHEDLIRAINEAYETDFLKIVNELI